MLFLHFPNAKRNRRFVIKIVEIGKVFWANKGLGPLRGGSLLFLILFAGLLSFIFVGQTLFRNTGQA